MMENYPRMVKPGHKPFDPVQLAYWTERIVCRREDNDHMRKYDSIHVAGVYRGISTGYAVGCCLRCIFCWSPPSRDFPEKYGRFLSSFQVFSELKRHAEKAGVRKCRLSGCEPTLCRKHLLSLLEYIEDDPYFRIFILETNGILFGVDKDYVRRLTAFSKVYVRVSLKAGTPKKFTEKTGAINDAFELPFRAIEHLLEYEIPFHVASMSLDPRIMDLKERIALASKLISIDPKLIDYLEEEIVDPYKMAIKRLKAAGITLKWPIEELYRPLKELIHNINNLAKKKF